MATWGYIRISNKNQSELRQTEEILPLVTTESHLIIEKQSGKDFNREKWISLKNIMRPKDILVVKSLDRLGRNYDQMRNEWKDLCNRQITIHVLDTPLLNTDNYSDDLVGDFISNVVFEVLSFVAENEREYTLQRQKEGIKVAKESGVKFGRPTVGVPDNWNYICERIINNQLSCAEAMRITGLKKTTFYKLYNEYKKSLSNK